MRHLLTGLFALTLTLPGPPAGAATVIGKLALDRGRLELRPGAETAQLKVRVTTPEPLALPAPIVYLTGLLNTEDTRPEQLASLEVNRFGPLSGHVALHLTAELEFINREGEQPLTVVIGGESKRPARLTLEPGKTKRHRFGAAGVYSVRVWPRREEVAYVLVVDSHYATAIDDSSTFRFVDLPPGKAELVVWHRGATLHSETITVPEEGVARITVEVARPTLGDTFDLIETQIEGAAPSATPGKPPARPPTGKGPARPAATP